MTGRARANGEGSIFPYRNGYAAYAWVRTPRGPTEEEVALRQDPRGGSRQVDEAPDEAVNARSPQRSQRSASRSCTGSTISSSRTLRR